MRENIGHKIRTLRNLRNFSQKGLASSAGITQENLSFIESNKMKKSINKDTFENIAKALGVTTEYIQNFDPDKVILNNFNDQAKQDVFIQHLSIGNQDKIINLQNETIEILQKLNEMYKAQLKNL